MIFVSQRKHHFKRIINCLNIYRLSKTEMVCLVKENKSLLFSIEYVTKGLLRMLKILILA